MSVRQGGAIEGSDVAITFTHVEGDLSLDGSKNILLQNLLCGSFDGNGSDLVALGNRGLAPIDAPACL